MRWPATWLSAHKAPVWILIIATLFSVPSLFCGFMNDDFLHNLIITHRSPVPKVDDVSIYGQFSFVSGSQERINKIIDVGAFPWWTDTSVKIAFFRPLAEITHGLDYTLWPTSPLMMHIHNVLWYLVFLFFAHRCFKQLFDNAVVTASLALFLYALDGSNGITVGWIANRCAILATGAALASFWYYMRWQSGQSPFWIAPVLFLIALLCAEYAISLMAFLVSYAIFIDKHNLRERIISLLPFVLVLSAWAIFYRQEGFGTFDSGLYLDPVRQSSEYLTALPDRLIVFIQAQLDAVPLVGQPHTVESSRIQFGFILLVFILFLPTLKRSANARFFLTGAILSLLPVAAAYPEDRVLLFSGFGFMGALAELFMSWFDKSLRPNYPKFIAFFVGLFTWFLLIIHAIISPLTFIPTYQLPFISAQKLVEQPALALPFDEYISNKTAIFINPPLAMLGSYFSAVRMVNHLQIPENSYFLAPNQHDIRIERISLNSLRITPEGGFMQIDFDFYTRSTHKLFKVGDKLHLTAMDVEITRIGPNGEPLQAIFSFKVPLEDPSLVWIAWTPTGINKFDGSYQITHPKDFVEH